MANDSGSRRADWPGRDGDPEVDADRVREIRRLWRAGCEYTAPGRWTPCPSGLAIFTPLIRRVELGDPTVVLVELRPGQLPEDITAAATRIARTMGIARLQVVSVRGMWVRVELHGFAPVGRPDAPASPVPPLRRDGTPSRARRGPSRAWTRRLHDWRYRRPEQPS